MESISQLLLLLKDLFLISKAVAQCYVLKSKLRDLLVLLEFTLLLHRDVRLRYLLASATVHSVLRDASLQLLELGLDLLALRLLFIQLCLQLRRHLVVTVLSLLQVESDLVNVGKRVQVFMFVHLVSIGLSCGASMVVSVLGVLLLLFELSGLHQHDLALELLVMTLDCVLLTESLFNRHDKFSA